METDFETKQPKYKFEDALTALLDNSRVFPPVYLHTFTDLTTAQQKRLAEIWERIDPVRRLNLFEDLGALAQRDYVLDFSSVARMGLDDEEGAIRMAAIYMLTDCQDKPFARRMLKTALEDPDEDVQCAAINVLSQYVLDLEYGNKTPVSGEQIIQTLEKLIISEKKRVRLDAMEALAFTDHQAVAPLIRKALDSAENEQVISALCAIEHTLDNGWDDTVLELLESDDADVKISAVRAAGELQIREALPFFYHVISQFDTQDQDLVMACVWAVSEIGDHDSAEVLDALSDAARGEDELEELIDEAIDNLNLTVQSSEISDALAETGDEAEETEEKEQFELELSVIRDRCLSLLEEKAEKLPPEAHEDSESCDADEDDSGSEADGSHHHQHTEIDPDHFRIIDDLEAYESGAEEDNEDDTDDEAGDPADDEDDEKPF